MKVFCRANCEHNKEGECMKQQILLDKLPETKLVICLSKKEKWLKMKCFLCKYKRNAEDKKFRYYCKEFKVYCINTESGCTEGKLNGSKIK